MFSVLQGEGFISPAEAGRLIPGRNAKAVHPSAVVRWLASGALDRAGNRIKLEGVKIGSKWLTSKPALDRFFAKLSADPASPRTAEPRSPAERTRASVAAARELELAGV